MKILFYLFLGYLLLEVRSLGICEENKKAPDFTINSIDGREIKLSNYKGKKVILNFWATWCPPCRAEIPDFVEFYNTNKNKVEIIGIVVGSKEEEIKNIVKQYNITYPVCISNRKIENLFGGINVVPTSFIIDENGYIKFKKIGIMDKTELEKILKEKQKD